MLPLEMFEQGVASSERFPTTSSVAGVRAFSGAGRCQYHDIAETRY